MTSSEPVFLLRGLGFAQEGCKASLMGRDNGSFVMLPKSPLALEYPLC